MRWQPHCRIRRSCQLARRADVDGIIWTAGSWEWSLAAERALCGVGDFDEAVVLGGSEGGVVRLMDGDAHRWRVFGPMRNVMSMARGNELNTTQLHARSFMTEIAAKSCVPVVE